MRVACLFVYFSEECLLGINTWINTNNPVHKEQNSNDERAEIYWKYPIM